MKPWGRYLLSALLIAGWTAFVKFTFPRIEIANLVMTYLLANVLIAVRYGQGPSIFSAVLSVALFDFFFVPPYLTFAVAEAKYSVTFLIMLGVTILTGRLMIHLRRNAEKANQAQIEAERESMMSSLLSSFSHDLRTPLTSIAGAASTLAAPEAALSETDRRRLCDTITQESDRMNRLVGNLVQITRVESGNLQIKKAGHSLEEIVGSALDRLEPLLSGRTITTEIPDDLTLVPLDDVLIEQVLINLIENAVRYTPAGSPIHIKTARDGQKAVVEVLDRGPGIPAGEKQRIFDKFYRGDSDDKNGSGLGLAICKGIVKAHRGGIGVKDRDGGGSVFYFSLPLEDEARIS